MNFLHFYCVYWSVGCCISQSIPMPISSTWRFKNDCIDKANPHDSTTYSITPRATGRTEGWHSTRTTCPAAASYRIIESTEWRLFNQTLRVSITGGDYYYYWRMYSIDYIHFLSTTKYQPVISDYVNNNNISGTSQLLRSTRYQVPGVPTRKIGRERKKIGKKVEKWSKENMRSWSKPSP